MKSCVCTGIRSCAICKPNKLKQNDDNYIDYLYCNECRNKAFKQELSSHSTHDNNSYIEFKDFMKIEGIFVKNNIIDVNQEFDLIRKIDSIQWIDSQSGRKKQDFGPKVNFKRQKVNLDQFNGLPLFDTQLLQQIREQMSDNCLLNDFIAVEVCHLDYNSLRGSSIDYHFDDFWIWGNRLLTVNLLSKTILNLVLPKEQTLGDHQLNYRIRIVVPQRALVILSDESRFKYQHSIQMEDINNRRVAITYRELSEPFLPNGPQYEKWGKHIIDRSLNALKF